MEHVLEGNHYSLEGRWMALLALSNEGSLLKKLWNKNVMENEDAWHVVQQSFNQMLQQVNLDEKVCDDI